MRDALYNVGNISAATKATDVYSADYIDLGTISSKSRFSKHTFPEELFACFRVTTAMNAADSFTPFIYHADDSAFSTNNEKLATFPTTGLGLAAGTIVRYRVPEQVREFVELGVTPQSTGTFTATTIESWLELGARAGSL